MKKKMVYVIKWVVHPHRADKRTGVIGGSIPRDPYVQQMFNEIESFFHGNKQDK